MSEYPIIPSELLPQDGRFGSGPSKVRPEQIEALSTLGRETFLTRGPHSVMGTSHRQAPVKSVVSRVREQLAELFSAPAGYEVVLGLGGSTMLWDALAFSAIQTQSAHAVCGEFSGKFATVTANSPWLADPIQHTAEPGSVAHLSATDGVDVYAWAHNETSTGATSPVQRVAGADGALMVVDATSAAGAIAVNLTETDIYYFAPQKAFGGDGGLWCALMSPAAIDQVGRICASERYIPAALNIQTAIEQSRLNQTINTPALATLIMFDAQLQWMLDAGGLAWAAKRSAESAHHIYRWADSHDIASCFVRDPQYRSPVVATIDYDDSVEASWLVAALRANGVVDVFPYRKLGRNQMRVGMFPNVDTADVVALTQCVDWLLHHVAS